MTEMRGTPDRIAVVGCGTMGAGIAQVAALAGHDVRMFDARPGAAASARESIAANLQKLVARGRIEGVRRDEAMLRLRSVDELRDLADVDLVIEAVREDLEVKRTLFAAVAQIVRPDTVLATNTSSLSVTAIASAVNEPQRVCGLHFFNPAQLMPLVEVVAGAATDPGLIDRMLTLMTSWGKTAVRVRSTPGFIVNRVARSFYLEPMRALQEGLADAATIDAIMRECGRFPMGPFELTDIIGQDVNFAVTRSLHEAFFGDARFAPSLVQQALVEAGQFGRKTGRGFYEYGPKASRPVPGVAPAAPPPALVRVASELGPLQALGKAFIAARLQVSVDRQLPPGSLAVADVGIALTDGRSATVRSAAEAQPNLVVCDLALDYLEAPGIAIAVSDQAAPESLATAAGLFQAIGKSVFMCADVPGLVVARTVAMLVNEASDVVLHGVATADDVDAAMRLGVGYPIGPLSWGDRLGAGWVARTLDGLMSSYGDNRYRVSERLRRVAARGVHANDSVTGAEVYV